MNKLKEIMKNKFNKISDLEERRLLRKILTDVYENMVDYNMEMYEKLEAKFKVCQNS